MGNFIALDVETANESLSSICQIGMVTFDGNKTINEMVSFVNPEDDFSPINISIHGINNDTIKNAPIFPDIAEHLFHTLEGNICVTHTSFDRISLFQAAEVYNVEVPQIRWLDSSMVARRAWKQFANKGYGLSNICKFIGYNFKPHDALEDAKAAGNIMTAAIEQTGIDVESWFDRVKQPLDPSKSSQAPYIKRHGNPDGPLYGEVIVFTGALSIPRNEAADIASLTGCSVLAGVTKKTTILVVGDQDVKKLAGHEKSKKHRYAEELISKGQPIRILTESDFREIASIQD